MPALPFTLSRRSFLTTMAGAGLGSLAGCYVHRPNNGAGATAFCPPRIVNPAAVGVPCGYRVDAVGVGLTYPTAVITDDADRVYVVEAGYSYGEDVAPPRLLRLEPDGTMSTIAVGEMNGPWTGGCFYNGAFYLAEGGELQGGRILRVEMDGQITPLLEGIPSMGDHHTNRVRVGPDGWLYFGVGTATNSGVVGVDNYEFGWLRRYPQFHDIPPHAIRLRGQNFESDNPFTGGTACTGAFVPFGTPTSPGQVIPGQLPCNGAILRMPPTGGQVEVVAWGLRNPFGLAFTPDGQLFATENSFDVRGSRPVWGTGDLLWCVQPGLWYGWPDFWAGEPICRHRFQPPHKDQPHFLLAEHPNAPPQPAAILGTRSSSDGLDFSWNPCFGHVGEAFVAVFGDMGSKRSTGKVLHPVGCRVVRVNTCNGVIQEFMVNKCGNGPASKIGGCGLERPVDVRFNNDGSMMYVVDFGVMTMERQGQATPYRCTGVLWRVTRTA